MKTTSFMITIFLISATATFPYVKEMPGETKAGISLRDTRNEYEFLAVLITFFARFNELIINKSIIV